MRTPRHGGRVVLVAALSFVAGVVSGWVVHDNRPPRPVVATVDEPPVAHPVATSGRTAARSAAAAPAAAIEALRQHRLRPPIDGVDPATFKGSFDERRGVGGDHPHEAVDILAPRNTPVRAVEDGTIARLFLSKAGGNTIYQFDPSGRFCYYYAHLERYAEGLHDHQHVAAGDLIGYVGTSGDAPANTPHLHFAVYALGPDKAWWRGTPLDPYLVFNK